MHVKSTQFCAASSWLPVDSLSPWAAPTSSCSTTQPERTFLKPKSGHITAMLLYPSGFSGTEDQVHGPISSCLAPELHFSLPCLRHVPGHLLLLSFARRFIPSSLQHFTCPNPPQLLRLRLCNNLLVFLKTQLLLKIPAPSGIFPEPPLPVRLCDMPLL